MSFTTRVVVGVCEEIGAQFKGCAVFFSVKQGLQSNFWGNFHGNKFTKNNETSDVEKTPNREEDQGTLPAILKEKKTRGTLFFSAKSAKNWTFFGMDGNAICLSMVS